MANRARGEASITLGGTEYTLALCLGALAELEDAFGVDNFEAALDFTVLSARRIRLFMRGVIKGNGYNLTPEVLTAIDKMEIVDFTTFTAALVGGAGMNEASAGEGQGESPLSVASDGGHG